MNDVKRYVQVGLIVFILTFTAGILTSCQVLNTSSNEVDITPLIVSIASLFGIVSSIVTLKFVKK